MCRVCKQLVANHPMIKPRQAVLFVFHVLLSVAVCLCILRLSLKTAAKQPLRNTPRSGLPSVVERYLECAHLIKGSFPTEGRSLLWEYVSNVGEVTNLTVSNLGPLNASTGYQWLRIDLLRYSDNTVLSEYRLTPTGRGDLGSLAGLMVAGLNDIPIPRTMRPSYLNVGESLQIAELPTENITGFSTFVSTTISLASVVMPDGSSHPFLEVRRNQTVRGGAQLALSYAGDWLRLMENPRGRPLSANAKFVLERGQGMTSLKCSLCHNRYRDSNLTLNDIGSVRGGTLPMSEVLYHWDRDKLQEAWLIVETLPANRADPKPNLQIEHPDSLPPSMWPTPRWMRLARLSDWKRVGMVRPLDLGPSRSYVEALLGKNAQVEVRILRDSAVKDFAENNGNTSKGVKTHTNN